jgi:hypothetical protein
MIRCSRLTVFPDCSRLPGFKSSLNNVHLKIFHALKDLCHPTDVCIVTVARNPFKEKVAPALTLLIKPKTGFFIASTPCPCKLLALCSTITHVNS